MAGDRAALESTPGTTPPAVLGPFSVQGPPLAEHGSDIANGLPGTPLWVDVRITDTDGNPVPDVFTDVWQSNKDGFYDVQLPDLDGPVGYGPVPGGRRLEGAWRLLEFTFRIRKE